MKWIFKMIEVKPTRICKELKELLGEIIKIEEERGIRCSYVDASRVLYKRIIVAGGLKKD